jgi:hypothetical protein
VADQKWRFDDHESTFSRLERLLFQLAKTDATRVSDMPRDSKFTRLYPMPDLEISSNGFAVTEKTLFQDLHQSVREQL